MAKRQNDDEKAQSNEMFYLNPDGTRDDKALWDELLGDDEMPPHLSYAKRDVTCECGAKATVYGPVWHCAGCGRDHRLEAPR